MPSKTKPATADAAEESSTVIAADGDTPAADANSADRSTAGEAREGVTYTATTDRGDGTEATTISDVAPSAAVTTAAALDVSPPANIAPATEFEPSGAPVQSSGFALDHASLDTNPRANTTEDQNRIDFNDPVRSGHEIVEARLSDSN